MLDLSGCDLLESDPEMLGGAWVFKGTRMPVFVIFENIAAGIDEVLELFPGVTREQIEAVLAFMAKKTKPEGWLD